MSDLEDEVLKVAFRASIAARGLPGQHNGPGDAARHAMASADATYRVGELRAAVASVARESKTVSDAGGSEETLRESRMDIHNDAVGRRLARKHEDMIGVVDELCSMLKKGSHEQGMIWIDGTQPESYPSGWEARCREHGWQSYAVDENARKSQKEQKSAQDRSTHEERERKNREAHEHNKRENVVDDDDVEKAKRISTTARPTEDGPQQDILIREQVLRYLQFMSALHWADSERWNEVMETDVPFELRFQRLKQLLRFGQSSDDTVVWGDDNNEEVRRKILEAFRKNQVPDETILRPDWSDPPKPRGN